MTDAIPTAAMLLLGATLTMYLCEAFMADLEEKQRNGETNQLARVFYVVLLVGVVFGTAAVVVGLIKPPVVWRAPTLVGLGAFAGACASFYVGWALFQDAYARRDLWPLLLVASAWAHSVMALVVALVYLTGRW